MVTDPVRTGDEKRRSEGGPLPAPSARPPIESFGGRWWVVHTKARNEKALAEDLTCLGICHFLPLARVRRRYGARTRFVRIPLFPGYLFLCGDGEERVAALRTGRVANVLNVVNQEGLKVELRQIQHAMSAGVPMDLYPGIRRGRRCRVLGGCLDGLVGVALRRRGVCRVYLAVETLGQSAEVKIAPELLDVIG